MKRTHCKIKIKAIASLIIYPPKPNCLATYVTAAFCFEQAAFPLKERCL